MERGELPQYERIGKQNAERPSARPFERTEGYAEHTEKSSPPERRGEVIDMEHAREELRGAYAREKPAEKSAGIKKEYNTLKKEIDDIEQTVQEYNSGPFWQKAWHYIFDSKQLKNEWNAKVHRLRTLEKRIDE